MLQNSSLSSVSADITRNIAGSLPRVPHWPGLSRLEAILPLPHTFREYLFWLPLIVGVTLLALLQVWTSLQISQTQVEVNSLRAQYVLKEQENAQLLWEISQFTTLERVVIEANAAGYVPALKRRYVTVEAAPGVYPNILPDGQVPTATTQVEGSAQTDAGSAQYAIQFSLLWDSWTGRWEQWRQAIGSSTQSMGNALQQEMMKIDISRFIGADQPQE